MGIIAALYVAIALLLAPFSFGAMQLRLSEMFNHLAVLNKRYIFGVTLGVAIANMFSPLGMVDVIVGSLATLMMLTVSYQLTKNEASIKKRMVINTVVCATLGMLPIALQLVVIFDLPFMMTYAGLIVGETISMTLGGVVMYQINKRLDLTQ